MENRGGWFKFVGGKGCSVRTCRVLVIFILIVTSVGRAELGPENLLILVNAESTTSQYIAKMYCEYYPAIADIQVLELSGLSDCSGPSSTPADEVITRDQYNTLIADKVRDHLQENGLLDQIMVIVTTAGIPYRIEDTNYSNVVDPAASNPWTVESNLVAIDAASVESELTCLWYADQFGINNRMVNPYQGYRKSPIDSFERLAPGSKTFSWWMAIRLDGVAPKMEGFNNYDYFPPIDIYGTISRQFHPGDIYLTCRLDGPKQQGQSAAFAVRQMLERSKLASTSVADAKAYQVAIVGVNPSQAAIVLDDAINPRFGNDNNRIYNLDGSTNYIENQAGVAQPPDAVTLLMKDDFVDCYTTLSNMPYSDGQQNVGFMEAGQDLCVLLDRRSAYRVNQFDFQALLDSPDYDFTGSLRAVALTSYGVNGDELHDKNYLLSGGTGGQPLFDLTNGAVFSSIESFNALTMFSDASITQAKIIDFIQIGGTGAIGHAFEPVSDAIVDNLYFFYNCFADENSDGQADLTFVEAAFTGIPYLSWSEVVIGDPLMRVQFNDQAQSGAWFYLDGDSDSDGRVNIFDLILIRDHIGGSILPGADPASIEKYDDRCDVDRDGRINVWDFINARAHL